MTLGEGGTPLLPSARLGRLVGLERLSFKLESRNPTGSAADRGSVAAAARALELGCTAVGTVAVGRAGASLAAYAARAGLSCTILLPEPDLVEGGDADADVETALLHGARVVVVSAARGATVSASLRAGRALGILFVNADDPIRLVGEKTLASELAEQCADAPPAAVFLPESTGFGAASLQRGFEEARAADLPGARSDPEVVAVPLDAFDRRDVESARALLAQEEGLLVSAASAAAFARLVRDVRSGRLATDGHAVVVVEAPAGRVSFGPSDPGGAPIRTGLRGLGRTLADPASWLGRQAPGRSW